MDLALELESIQEQIHRLQRETDDFEKKSKITIEDDQITMLAKLRDSIESIEQAQKFLETGRSQPAGDIEYKPDVEEKTAPRALVRHHAADLSVRFDNLRTAASNGLNNVADVKLKWDDFDAEACQLHTQIQTLAERSQTAVASAERLLAQNERSIQQASETLKTQEVKLQRLRDSAESEKRERNAFAIGTGVGILASIFFPPAAVTLLPLVAGTGVSHYNLSVTEDEIRDVKAQLSSLRSESETLQKLKASLQEATAETHQLRSRSEALGQKNNAIEAIIDEKLKIYHDFKASADKFGAWTYELAAQVDAMELIGPSEKALRETVQWIAGNSSGERLLGNMSQLLASIPSSDAGE
ncbi:hypothetical protein F4861DRAFT_542652 [Xylaria intraflava]|nr:hypothetical protein F4861DRAFT_542652 [Xylaria intraflava]